MRLQLLSKKQKYTGKRRCRATSSSGLESAFVGADTGSAHGRSLNLNPTTTDEQRLTPRLATFSLETAYTPSTCGEPFNGPVA